MKKAFPGKTEELEKEIRNVEIKFLGKEMLSIDKHQMKLNEIRSTIKHKLQQLNDLDSNEEYRINSIVEIFKNMNESFLQLINSLISDCLEELGDNLLHSKKVEYCIYGMGSLSLGTSTPWSDLEFGILLSDEYDEALNYPFAYESYKIWRNTIKNVRN